MDDDESAAIQIMLKPIGDTWQKECAKQSRAIMNGKKSTFTLNPFKLIYRLITALISSQDENTPKQEEKNTSALSQERAKTVDEKGEKTGFETIIRIIVT
jgi:hypothetical protein